MDTKRLFIGTFIDLKIIVPYYQKLQADFNNVCTGRWVEPEHIHFTFQFLGDTKASLIDRIKENIEDMVGDLDYPLKFKGLGAFPNIGKPTVLYIKIFDENKILDKLHSKINSINKKFGFEPENKKFTPHVTIRRIKSSMPDFFSVMQAYDNFLFGKMESFEVNLVESILSRNGPTYVKL